MQGIKLRQCTPDDLEQAIPLIYSSGPDAFEYVFKNDRVTAQDFLRYAFCRKGGTFSYDNHHALIENEKLLGIGAVYAHTQVNAFTLKDASSILQFYKHRAFPIVVRGLRTEQIILPPQKNEILLANLGVDPQNRGRGLGTKMIELLMEVANKKESTYFVLDVSEENPRAKDLYERLNFKISNFTPSTLRNKFSYVPNHYRMELK